MNNPGITIVGTHGRNLSLYLKDYLQTKGIRSYAVGVNAKSQAEIRRIENAETLICIHEEIRKVVEDQFNIVAKQVICLDVVDSPESSSKKPLTGELWLEYQENHARPRIKQQINKKLSQLM